MARYMDLYMDQGSSFLVNLPAIKQADGTVMDLTGFDILAQMSRSYYSSPDKQIPMVTSVIDPKAGLVSLSLTAEITSGIRPARYVYDCAVVDTSGFKTKIFEGIMTVVPAVTNQSGITVPAGHTVVSYLMLRAAVSQQSIPALLFSTPFGAAPTAVQVVGANTITGAASFANNVVQQVQDFFILPATWVPPLDVEILWRTPLTTGSVFWQIEIVGVPIDQSLDQPFGSPNIQAAPAGSTPYEINRTVIHNIDTTGISANEQLFFRFSRLGTSDTLAGAAELLALRFVVRRNT